MALAHHHHLGYGSSRHGGHRSATHVRDNTAEIVTTEQLAVSPLTTHDHGQSINFEYKWSTADLPTHTEVYGNLTPSAFNKIQPITWNFRVYTEDGELKVKHDTPVPIPLSNMDNAKAEYAVYFIGNTLHRRPNGSMVAEHRLCLECALTVTPSLLGQATLYRVEAKPCH